MCILGPRTSNHVDVDVGRRADPAGHRGLAGGVEGQRATLVVGLDLAAGFGPTRVTAVPGQRIAVVALLGPAHRQIAADRDAGGHAAAKIEYTR